MFDRDALNKIEEMTNTRQLDTDCPSVLKPDNMSAQSLEKLMSGRFRFRANMTTTSIDDFVRYVHDYEQASCFVDAEKMTAQAFFNLGSVEEPGHGDDTARLKLKRTAPFDALLELDGTRCNQRTLAEWLEDWNGHLKAFDGEGNEIPMRKAVSAVRQITIESKSTETSEDTEHRASRSAFAQMEVKNPPPAGFVFTCEPYHGLASREFRVRLSVLKGQSEPTLIPRIICLEAQRELMALEFKNTLTERFAETVHTYIGILSV